MWNRVKQGVTGYRSTKASEKQHQRAGKTRVIPGFLVATRRVVAVWALQELRN